VDGHYLRPSTPEEVAKPGTVVAAAERPSIAVLPFDNMTGDANQEYFSDSITEEIISRLSKNPDLFVISRNSTFTYKGKAVKVQQVARELGAKHVLEGSVRRSEDRIRITAQLVDAATDSHLWTETYEQEMKDIFAVQSEIAQHIAAALGVEYREAELDRVRRMPTENLSAYDAYWKAYGYLAEGAVAQRDKAKELLKKAIALDPEYAEAYALLGDCYQRDYTLWRNRDPQLLEDALALAKQSEAVSGEPVYDLLSTIYSAKGQLEQALSAAERHLDINPNSDIGYLVMGTTLNSIGRPEDAIEMLKKAMQLNPKYGYDYSNNLARSYLSSGRYHDAIAVSKRTLLLKPDYSGAYWVLQGAHNAMGQYGKVIAISEEAFSQNPDWIWMHQAIGDAYSAMWRTQQSDDPEILNKAIERTMQSLAPYEYGEVPALWGHHALGAIYLSLRQYDRAIAEAHKVIEIDPKTSFTVILS